MAQPVAGAHRHPPPPPHRFATGFAYYSLAMGVEEFGVNLYLLQVIFGGVDIPAKFITALSLSYLGRHTTEVIALLLAGTSILALLFVPAGEKRAPRQRTLQRAEPRRPRLRCRTRTPALEFGLRFTVLP